MILYSHFCVYLSQAIPNVNGIVKYELSLGVDHEAGRSLVDPVSWKEVEEFQVSFVQISIKTPPALNY